ncbi:hypothetical protein I7I50_05637 [Histoplasma capsulatum G186AR]|uniref:Uncharacterized protein n=1 Tax=Ajellomyces capsulatus TaxID=5037 RepID=A0A8H7ZAP3_AJECA|nr:hypothetical protein I7I52_03897 [Histoplasma capsulatum]QSS76249.1 hypothetical protein I7I50_05637 [Histoplasma capsulatum G186AR]
MHYASNVISEYSNHQKQNTPRNPILLVTTLSRRRAFIIPAITNEIITHHSPKEDSADSTKI